MNLLQVGAGLAGLGAGILGYGAWTSDRISYETPCLKLPRWPSLLSGLRVGLIADLHLRRDGESVRLTRQAVAWLRDQDPDVVVIAGDIIAYWQPGVSDFIDQAFADVGHLSGKILAISGNHDSFGGRPDLLASMLERHGIDLLMNRSRSLAGVSWVGLESATVGQPDVLAGLQSADLNQPLVALWHEPDFVDFLPGCFDLMLAGHSHGGQFCLPGGWAPMTSRGGSKYRRGFFPDLAVPLYVSRGLATTGPPSRFCCPAECSVLTLLA